MSIETPRRPLLGFPNPVNETSARLVAAGVVAQAIVFLTVRNGWLLVPLVFGFAARVLSGPRFSPLGLLATRVVTPRLAGPHRFVPGPPKRFAQAVGLSFSAAAAIAWWVGGPIVAFVLIAFLMVAALLESAFAICLGCIVFSALIRVGAIPERACVECADLGRRLASQS